MRNRVIILSILAVIILIGCEKKESSKTNDTELSNVQSEDLIEHDIIYEEKTFEASKEILNSELGSGLIQIGNTIVRLPMQVSDLTEQTNATYFSVDYEPNIMSNEYLLTKDDESVLAGLSFLDADCTAVYWATIPEIDTCTAGELYIHELREITSENIILPKGIKVGMSLEEIKTLFGDNLKIGYSGDEDAIEYEVQFFVDDSDAIECCNNYYKYSYTDKECPEEYVGFLYLDVNRSTGTVQELTISYGYDVNKINKLHY